jgi:hypothetical protein
MTPSTTNLTPVSPKKKLGRKLPVAIAASLLIIGRVCHLSENDKNQQFKYVY